jgi:hypothetical protein
MKWEYKSVTVELSGKSGDPAPLFNRLGSLGWELVSIVRDPDWKTSSEALCIFKRHLK